MPFAQILEQITNSPPIKTKKAFIGLLKEVKSFNEGAYKITLINIDVLLEHLLAKVEKEGLYITAKEIISIYQHKMHYLDNCTLFSWIIKNIELGFILDDYMADFIFSGLSIDTVTKLITKYPQYKDKIFTNYNSMYCMFYFGQNIPFNYFKINSHLTDEEYISKFEKVDKLCESLNLDITKVFDYRIKYVNYTLQHKLDNEENIMYRNLILYYKQKNLAVDIVKIISNNIKVFLEFRKIHDYKDSFFANISFPVVKYSLNEMLQIDKDKRDFLLEKFIDPYKIEDKIEDDNVNNFIFHKVYNEEFNEENNKKLLLNLPVLFNYTQSTSRKAFYDLFISLVNNHNCILTDDVFKLYCKLGICNIVEYFLENKFTPSNDIYLNLVLDKLNMLKLFVKYNHYMPEDIIVEFYNKKSAYFEDVDEFIKFTVYVNNEEKHKSVKQKLIDEKNIYSAKMSVTNLSLAEVINYNNPVDLETVIDCEDYFKRRELFNIYLKQNNKKTIIRKIIKKNKI